MKFKALGAVIGMIAAYLVVGVGLAAAYVPSMDIDEQLRATVMVVEDENSKPAFQCGAVIVAKNKVLTANHCVDGETLDVQFYDGRRATGKVIAVGDQIDAALIEVDTGSMPVARTQRTAVGADVCAIGAPKGWGWSYGCGVVSAFREASAWKGTPPELSSWIQTNMNINGGNSGGPLFARGGGLVGIVIWGARLEGSGIDFTMPIDEALKAVGL